jgi:hypothetical protein
MRAVQTEVENDFVKSGRFIWMQGMLDLGYRYKAVTAVMSVGKFDRQGKGSWTPYSERYYLIYQISDANLIRIGRILPSFGLNIPEHISPTRGGTQGNGLGFGIGQERDAEEWNYIGENWNAALGYAKGPRDQLSPLEESVYAQLQRSFFEHYKIGVSAWSGHSPTSTRQIFAAHGLLGFTPKFYLVSEVDWQFLQPNLVKDQVGIFGYHKLGYEFHKGMHAFLLLDHMQPDLDNNKTYIRHWGPGLAFFPRPHFELSATWTREQVNAASNHEGDYAWLLMHYYL